MISKIKKFSFVVLLTTISAFTANAQNATNWKLDKAHSSVNFSINHFFSEITGKFTDFNGTFNFDPNNLKGSQFTFTISVSSVNTDNSKRDKHIQSKDFFDAKSYSKIKFVSTKFEKKSDKEFFAHGKLTIRNKTKDVILPFKITGEIEHPMMKGTIVLGLSLNITLNRSDYNVGTGDWAATMVVGDEVRISIPIELNRKIVI